MLLGKSEFNQLTIIMTTLLNLASADEQNRKRDE